MRGLASERTKELTDVPDERLRFLEGSEMSATRHLRPALDVEESLGPLTRW